MDRKEMLEKLHSINATSANFVATFDMGLQFDVMTGEGVTTDLGNVGSWPYVKIKITERIKSIRTQIIDGKDVSTADILEEKELKWLLTYCDLYRHNCWTVEGELLENCVANLKKELAKINVDNEYCYAYVDLEDWSDGDLFLFESYEEMCSHFVDYFGTDLFLYEDMSDEELERAYAEAEENGWNSVKLRSFREGK